MYGSSEGVEDATNDQLICLVSMNFSVVLCDDTSLSSLEFSGGGKICGDMDVGASVLCGRHNRSQRLKPTREVRFKRYRIICDKELV